MNGQSVCSTFDNKTRNFDEMVILFAMILSLHERFFYGLSNKYKSLTPEAPHGGVGEPLEANSASMCSDTVCVLPKHNVCSPTRCVRREGFGPLLALWQCPASESVVVVLVPHSNTRKQFSLRSLEIHQVFFFKRSSKRFFAVCCC